MDLDEFDLEGIAISPVLANGKKNLLIDMDGTVCDDVPNEEPERMVTAKVYEGARETINNWYDEGHVITFFTSRESAKHREISETWLNKHGFKYHHLLMDKPRGGNYHWIDNHIVKGIKYSGSWPDVKEDTER